MISRLKNAKDRMFNLSFPLNKWTCLAFILMFATIAVFDSIIVKFSSYTGIELSEWSNVAIFVIFFTIFAISTILLLNSATKSIKKNRGKESSLGKLHFRGIILTTQILTLTITLMIIFQILFQDKYSLTLLELQTVLSRLSGLALLTPLIYLFASWLISKRNYIIALYTLSFSLLAINLVISLIYLIYLQSYYSFSIFTDVKPYPIDIVAANIPASIFTERLALVFDILSITSFLLMWTATLISLVQYRYRMGNMIYFILMSVPLIYFVFPFHNYLADMFPLLQSTPIFITVVYVLIFSASEQVAAVLFSLVFWTSSTLVYNNTYQRNLLISAIGMAIIFGSIEISTLQYRLYPPYGLVTQAFIPIGAYLLFVGTFSSAKQISEDAKLRKDFYSVAKSRINLLRTIGVTQMEKELIKNFKIAEKRTVNQETVEEYYPEEDVRKIVHEVLEELKRKDIGKTKES